MRIWLALAGLVRVHAEPFAQSDFYTVNDAVQDGHIIQNVFGTRSNAFHSRYMKPIQKLYSMNSMLSMEGLVDKTIRSLCEQIENRFVDGKNAHKTCDISDWIEFCNYNYSSISSSLPFSLSLLIIVKLHRRVGCCW